jgi:hypothetical protein
MRVAKPSFNIVRFVLYHVMDVDRALGWDIALGIQLFVAAIVIYISLKIIKTSRADRNGPQYRSAAILVLGDIGRSPRMMYHAQSFAGHNFQTHIIAYEG